MSIQEEPNVCINGIDCDTAEAMTIRVAVESLANQLEENGLGEDATGRAIVQGYMLAIDRIREKIFGKQNNKE